MRMNSVLNIIEEKLNHSVANNKLSVAGENEIRIALVIFSSLMAFFGAGVFVYGSYIWLDNSYDIITVIFVMGGIFCLLSIIGGIALYNIELYKRKKIQKEKEYFINMVKDVFEIFQQELEAPVNDNPKTAILIATISGYLAGERFL